MANTRVLFSDIDGVLHNTALIESVDLAGLAAQSADKLVAIGLFSLRRRRAGRGTLDRHRRPVVAVGAALSAFAAD